MSLITSAVIVSLAIAVFTALPWLFSGLRRYSKALLLVGTAVLFGVCFFDLVPEMFEIGGITSVVIMVAAWGLFAGVHYLMALGHDHATAVPANRGHGGHSHAGSFLLASMALHCFAGGMLLVSSYEISSRLAFHVFLGLIVHKGFEAISMASVLIDSVRSRRQVLVSVLIYALSFPAGVIGTLLAKTYLFEGLAVESVETIAMVITSVAVGSLFGCLLQDFLLPTLREFRAASTLKPTVPLERSA